VKEEGVVMEEGEGEKGRKVGGGTGLQRTNSSLEVG
jgi:hypothetical protein